MKKYLLILLVFLAMLVGDAMIDPKSGDQHPLGYDQRTGAPIYQK